MSPITGASLDSLNGITRALDAQVHQIDTLVNDAEAAERRHADDVLGAATCAQLRVFLASLEQPWAPPGGIDAHSWSRDELRAWLARGSLGAPDEDELDRIFNALEDAPGEPLTFENFARLGEVRPRDDVAHEEWLP